MSYSRTYHYNVEVGENFEFKGEPYIKIQAKQIPPIIRGDITINVANSINLFTGEYYLFPQNKEVEVL